MKITEMTEMIKTGRFKAIIKQVGTRRMFVGIERSKRSRKSQIKYMCPPQDLDQLVEKHNASKDAPPAA
jgi:hypothetical protein